MTKSRDELPSLEHVSLGRLNAIVFYIQSGVLALHDLSKHAEKFPANSRLVPRHRVASVVKELRLSRRAARLAIETLESVLSERETKPVRKSRKGCMVIDFAKERARRVGGAA